MTTNSKSESTRSSSPRGLSPQSVRCHRFAPSGRVLWTFVGSEGDHLVDDVLHYCSCSHFYYRVLGDKDSTCHHIESLKLAKMTNDGAAFAFDDSEYAPFLRALLGDLSKEYDLVRDQSRESE